MHDNLFSNFAGAARRDPHRVFLETRRREFTFAEMLEQVSRTAGALGQHGIKPGDRVMVQIEKTVEAVWLYLACLQSGIVFIPLNTAYTATELHYFLEDAQPSLFVCDPKTAEAIDCACPVWTLDAEGAGSLATRSKEAEPRSEVAPRRASDVAAILYTSGTTGRSKGAMLTHGNLHSNVETLCRIWRWRDDDILLHMLPIFHAHGLFVGLHCSLFAGTRVLFHQRFDAETALEQLARSTVFMGVPTFYVRLLKLDGFDRERAANMRLFISGSAPLTEPVFEAFEQRTGQRILERYGMTEALMITSNPYDGPRVAGTVGLPLPGVSVRLEEGAEDEPGVLEIRGPNVFAGYWQNPEKTAEAFTADGWFRTGDIATIDGDGRVALVGRSSDMIISGGYNVYPKEIELLIGDIEGVEEAAVVGVPHPDFGEAVIAVVVPSPGKELEAEGLLAELRGRLADFKRPKRLLIIDELPRNAMGKVQKAELRRQHAELFEG